MAKEKKSGKPKPAYSNKNLKPTNPKVDNQKPNPTIQKDKEPPKIKSVLLNKIAFNVSDKEKGKAIKGLPATVTIQSNKVNIPLGVLATNHVGYVSFDVSKAVNTIISLNPDTNTDSKNVKEFLNAYGIIIKARFKTTPELYFEFSSDLKDAGVLNDAFFADIVINSSQNNCLCEEVGLNSIQEPSITDWQLSSGSFALNPNFFIGADGCENLYPANFATHEYKFFHVAKTNDLLITGSSKPNSSKEPNSGKGIIYDLFIEKNQKIYKGYIYNYKTIWQPLGHTLGEIVYSLPLAPGEIVKIAVIDWERQSTDSRDERLDLGEKLNHDTLRDRTISETVESVLNEMQKGSTFQAGGAVSGSYGGVVGGSISMGGGRSSSEGNRELNVTTAQDIADGFSQATTAMREYRSTVVVQSNQKEGANARTRVVANHNHSHALTMLYYEVLRHYKLTSKYVSEEEAVFVDYSNVRFDFSRNETIIKYKHILKQVLLDPSLKDAIELIEKFAYFEFIFSRITNSKAQADFTFSTFQLKIKTASVSYGGTDSKVFGSLIKKDGIEIGRTYFNRSGYDDFEQGDNDTYQINLGEPIKWGDIANLKLKLEGSDNWTVGHIVITGLSFDGNFVLADLELNELLSNSELLIPLTQPKPTEALPTAANKLTDYENVSLFKLKNHLRLNSDYYQRLIWLYEDPNERAQRFNNVNVGSGKLIDILINSPIDVLGNYVIFKTNSKPKAETGEEFKYEKLVTLPTRGVFGEAKLGHCNASELIDNTRFWDWQQSPIPLTAPDILPVSTESRNVTQDLTPSNLPSSIVNIVNPSPAPDPTGMANALEIMGKSDIFRDMSTSKEVNDLLQKLSDNSITALQATSKAKEIQKKRAESNGNSNSRGSSNNSQNSQPTLTPEQANDALNVISKAKQQGVISNEEAQKLSKNALDGMFPSKDDSASNNAKSFTDSELDHIRASWDFLLNFIVPSEIQRNINARGFAVQSIQDEDNGDDTNLDKFRVEIKTLPINSETGNRFENQSAFLNYVRKNINSFIDTQLTAFSFFDSGSDQTKWNSNNPLGAMLKLDIKKNGITVDRASVVCSLFEETRWVFSTTMQLSSPSGSDEVLAHPVSGNREFGVYTQNDKVYIYTKGVDRPFLLNSLPIASGETLQGGSNLWRSFQAKILDYVNSNGGEAVRKDPEILTEDWDELSSFL